MNWKQCAGTMLVIAALRISAHSQLAAPTAISDAGFSACSHNTCTFVPESEKPTVYRRGNLSYTVRVPARDEGGTFVMRRGRKVLLTTPLKDLSASVSVVWSQKSDWFAVTWSDGGAIGNFHTRIFHVVDEAVQEFPTVRNAFRSFRSRHWCRVRGDNVQAYRWDESGAIVLVMSVYPTGDCGEEAGHMEAYFVRPTDGIVLRRLTAARLDAYIKTHPVW